MNQGIAFTGIPSKEELNASKGIPTEKRMTEGAVAVIECVQEIPCNPCESACKFGAIQIGHNITALPCLKEEKCTGCGACVAACPGLAITIINKAYSSTEATIDFPFEYLPLPKEGDIVEAVNRSGETVCKGRIIKIKRSAAYEGTCVVQMAVPTEFINEVRSMKRLVNK